MKEIEAKLPDDYVELNKLSKTWTNYETKSDKSFKKCSKINKKIRKIGNEIKSRIEIDESNYSQWTAKDVVKFVLFITQKCEVVFCCV